MPWSCPSSALEITYGLSGMGKSSARLPQPTWLFWRPRCNLLWKHILILARCSWLTWVTMEKNCRMHTAPTEAPAISCPLDPAFGDSSGNCASSWAGRRYFPLNPFPRMPDPQRLQSRESFQKRWKKSRFYIVSKKGFLPRWGYYSPTVPVRVSALCVWRLTSAFKNSCDLTTNCYCSFDFISRWQCLGRALPSADALCGRRSAGTGVFPW